MNRDPYEITIEEHREALLTAYQKKTIRNITAHESKMREVAEKRVLKPLEPIRDLFTVGKVVPPIKNKWWNKKPTIAGECCNKRQHRIANCRTDAFKMHLNEMVGADHDEGDFYKDPRKARKLLQGKSYRQLTNSKQTADFKSEVTWLLELRQF